ncbi:Acylphosphatase [Methylobrevis pamukkalensis]|uniref:acylphosphatase n=2 Tax=Methylobrevis pamukkalensis TaxID=1439726 RepID=A0A1E3H081_9HYPH|nr:Acylphosphatase [Methylobrevis pamukkalensis]
MKALHVTIRGHVQGVGYREWCGQRARQLGLSGWVRNRAGGDVEALFCGAEADVFVMIEDCRRGPIHARVAAVETDPEAEPVNGPFAIRPTV